MKRLACAFALFLSTVAMAQESRAWLDLLNAEAGRKHKLSEKEVVFRPSTDERYAGLVAAGFRQSDGSLSLGSVIWDGKVWSPLAAYAQILRSTGFAEADDQTRSELFVTMLQQSNAGLGIHPYVGEKSREENRPQPVTGQRQADGKHRFVVWFYADPGNREGPEWRQVLYVISMEEPAVFAKTLQTFHPVAEGLRGFPSQP